MTDELTDQTDADATARKVHQEDVDEIIPNGGRDEDGSARMLSRWTFQYTPAREIVDRHLSGRTLNACAGKTKLTHDDEIVRNDLNTERDADLHVDVAHIGTEFDPNSFDTIIFDPPFDEEQAETKYDGMHASDVWSALEQFRELCAPGGKVLSFGWNSWGMKSYDEFERVNVKLLQRGPIHRDVIVRIDRRNTHTLASDGGNAW